MSTALTTYTAKRAESALVPASIAEAMQIGELMTMFDGDGNKANAIAKVVAGMEFGIGPMAAIRGIHMIKGKPSLSADLLATLIKRSGRYDFRSKVSATEATVTVFDRGESLEPVTFTMKDAETAGLVAANPQYKKYPGDMLYTKAMVRAVKRHCPEVAGGAVYDEDGEAPSAPPASYSTETGEVIDSTATETPATDDATVGRERFAKLRESGLSDERIVEVLKEHGIASSAALADDEAYFVAVDAVEDAMPATTSDEVLADQLFADTAETSQGEDPHS